MQIKWFHLRALFLAGLIACAPAFATTITFDFTSTSLSPFTNSSTTNYGNVLTFTQAQAPAAGGITMKAAAYSTVANTATLQTSYLAPFASFAYGLGVCDQGVTTVANCSNDFANHQIDTATSGVFDYIVFQFSSTVIINNNFFTLNPYLTNQVSGTSAYDRDVTFWYGNVTNPTFSAGPTSLTGKALNDTFFGGLTRVDVDNTVATPTTTASDAISLALSGPKVINTLIIGSRTNLGAPGTTPLADAIIDRWKADQLVVTTTPEPGTFAMVGIALVTLGLLRRKTQPTRS